MEELRKCLGCGYERGFHISFKKVNDRMRVGIICPNCGQSYDIGWFEEDIKGDKAEKGAAY